MEVLTAWLRQANPSWHNGDQHNFGMQEVWTCLLLLLLYVPAETDRVHLTSQLPLAMAHAHCSRSLPRPCLHQPPQANYASGIKACCPTGPALSRHPHVLLSGQMIHLELKPASQQ